MDPAALAARLEAVEGRLAGSDAERRAAALCAGELRAGGRRPSTRTLWVRGQRAGPRALVALAGVAASVVSVSHPEVGAGLAGGALAAVLLDAAGLPPLLLLVSRRATQNVLAPPPQPRGARAVLILAASVDAPRTALARRLERTQRRGPVPGPLGWLTLALLALLMCTGARVAGAEGTWIGALQLVPTIALIALTGLFADAATGAAVRPAPAGGPGAALAVARALDARAPRALAVEVVIAGAGTVRSAGMTALVAERRRRLAAEDVVVLELRSGAGSVRCVTRDGELFGSRLHPRLTELALALPGVEPMQSRTHGAARAARAAGWPAVALEGESRALAMAALRLVAAVDREVASRRG